MSLGNLKMSATFPEKKNAREAGLTKVQRSGGPESLGSLEDSGTHLFGDSQPCSDLLRTALITYLQPSIIVADEHSSDQSHENPSSDVCHPLFPPFQP